MLLALAALLLLPVPPPPRDHFPDDPGDAHVFLAIDARSGEIVRSDAPVAADREWLPAGETARVLVALAGLEDGVLGPDETIACDDDCWAKGRHGELPLAEALAYSCDTYFREAVSRVPATSLTREARRAGFERRPRTPTGGDEFDPDWDATAREWVEFWSRLTRGDFAGRSSATSTLLAAATLAVSSPRGTARALYDPRHRAGAITGSTSEGVWVTGSYSAHGFSWVFALFVREGTDTLGAARAARLLEETLRVFQSSTYERGGFPLPPLDER